MGLFIGEIVKHVGLVEKIKEQNYLPVAKSLSPGNLSAATVIHPAAINAANIASATIV